LLVMGRPEGSGCYCAVNNILRKIIERLSSNYDAIVIDTEAGLEHLSRRTTQNVDLMLVVTDPSKRGILTAKRIEELSDSLDISFKKIYLVLNRVKDGTEDELTEEVDEIGLEIAGIIHEDELIESYDRKGKPLIYLPDDTQAVASILKITEKFDEN
ncbi:MAG TPA: ATP-binding protein, partial [Methanobacterium sp.]